MQYFAYKIPYGKPALFLLLFFFFWGGGCRTNILIKTHLHLLQHFGDTIRQRDMRRMSLHSMNDWLC